jgi:hypothetical protein
MVTKNEIVELRIKSKMTISELQKQFSDEFPYLKLEFFDIPYSPGKLSKAHQYPANRLLGVCSKIRHEGTITITPADTVGKLEQIFCNEFGLTAEVFRKSGNLWIETSLSNSWTLKLQNDEGKALSEGRLSRVQVEGEDIVDRDKWQ